MVDVVEAFLAVAMVVLVAAMLFARFRYSIATPEERERIHRERDERMGPRPPRLRHRREERRDEPGRPDAH